MGEFGPWHLLIVAGVFVLLFGAKRLPDAARSLGKSARIMKTELHSLHDDEKPPAPIAP
jgi:sec-independent protein translocase protein TatA